MITKLSNKITAYFVVKDIISIEEIDIYEYSFELMLASIFNLIAIIAIGFGTSNFIETILFAITFVTIRTVAGGYHASTHFRCMIILIIDFSALIIMLELMPAYIMNIVNIILIVVGVIIILILPTVDSANNKLSSERKNKLKLISVLYVVFYSVVSMVLIYFSIDMIALSITYSVFSVALSMLAGTIKNNFKGGKYGK